MAVAKKAVKKVAKKVVVSETTPKAEVISQTTTAQLVKAEFHEGKKVVSRELCIVNGVKCEDITVEGGITYRVNI